MSDNGGHYHNADLMMIMAFWPKWYNVEVKTAIDSHHMQVNQNQLFVSYNVY